MRSIRDVLRYSFEKKLTQRRIAAITGVERTSVGRILKRFQAAALTWPLSPEIDSEQLYKVFYPNPVRKRDPSIDFNYIAAELRKKGATLEVLYGEWVEEAPELNRLSYSQFCRKFAKWEKSSRLSMRQTIRYGHAIYVDYSGTTLTIKDRATGIKKKAQVFIAVLGGSKYTYCEASWTQRSADWLASHVRMLQFFGGASEVIVPDNLKSAVTNPDIYTPEINTSYMEFCKHYDIIPEPARPWRPKDKASVESGVGYVKRAILFCLRNKEFESLEEANREIRVLLEKINNKLFQKRSGSRTQLWLTEELPALAKLPPEHYEICEWGKIRAGSDYCVRVDGHYYSVPHQLRGTEFEYRLTESNLELFQRGKVIATHMRSRIRDHKTMLKEHLHSAHAEVEGWSREEAIEWATTIGPMTAKQLGILLDLGRGNLSGYRSTGAIRRIAKEYSNVELEEACTYACRKGIHGSKMLRSILSKKLHRLLPDEPSDQLLSSPDHENIRGKDHYEEILNHENGESNDE